MSAQDDDFTTAVAEKDATIADLMEKVKRLRAQFREERKEYRVLEDELEEAMDSRLVEDEKIQSTKADKDP